MNKFKSIVTLNMREISPNCKNPYSKIKPKIIIHYNPQEQSVKMDISSKKYTTQMASFVFGEGLTGIKNINFIQKFYNEAFKELKKMVKEGDSNG